MDCKHLHKQNHPFRPPTRGIEVTPLGGAAVWPRPTRLRVEPEGYSPQAVGKLQNEKIRLGMRPALDHTAQGDLP